MPRRRVYRCCAPRRRDWSARQLQVGVTPQLKGAEHHAQIESRCGETVFRAGMFARVSILLLFQYDDLDPDEPAPTTNTRLPRKGIGLR